MTKLTDKSLVLIFAYAPVGFGHLRVTDALYHGLPKDTAPLLLGSQDQSITSLYHFISIHPFTRWVMTWFQEGVGEALFMYLYKQYYRNSSKLLYQQLVTILQEQIEVPKTVVIVATHFGLAHQLTVIKEKLEKENNIRIVLVVQITDDSPQYIWYVDGANMIFSPSQHTKEQLLKFAALWRMKKTHIVVNSYPVSPFFARPLADAKWEQRQKLFHIMIPLSGAAVGTDFFTSLIETLHSQKEHPWMFHVVVKDVPYTKQFLKRVLGCWCVDLHVGKTDREVIDLYEQAYQKEPIALEITKPSEQAFKALLLPKQVGGSILLFTQAVGRQEEDNLAFLRRHNLIPGIEETRRLWKMPNTKYEIRNTEGWRGVQLPNNPDEAATFIIWLKTSGIFTHMLGKKAPPKNAIEIQSNGVETFWEKVEEYLG